MSHHRLSRLALFSSLFALLVLIAPRFTASAQSAGASGFTVLGPTGAIARAFTGSPTCPEISIDGKLAAMELRAPSTANFPVTVCDALIPAGVQSASINGQPLRLPKANPERIVVLGDSGCRLKGDFVQSCNDPAEWPLARIAASAAAYKPDLVIHVGDFHYRESPCVLDKANCAGSPYGDNWDSWNADLFTPAASLLAAAPWVVVRGNHEDCARAGNGYFRLVDPLPLPSSCPQYVDPYALDYMDPQLIVMDDSAVDDRSVKPDQLAAYKTQLTNINAMAKGQAWFLLHDPFYIFGHAGEQGGKEQLFMDQPTLQQAINNQFSPAIQLFVSGHIHLFEALSFGQGRPPQLLVGNSGTLLDPAISTPLTGLEIAGMKVSYGSYIDRFGYVTMDRRSDGSWAVGVHNVAGGEMDKCLLSGATLQCGLTALPKLGGDVTEASQLWLVIAFIGGAMLFAGLAVRMRGLVASD